MTIVNADCLEWMKSQPVNSIDCIITDENEFLDYFLFKILPECDILLLHLTGIAMKNKSFGQFIQINPDIELTEIQKQYIESFAKEQEFRLNSLAMSYKPSCGCDCKMDFILDRYPMSEKIHTTCPICEKGVLAELIRPYIFYFKLWDKEFSWKEVATECKLEEDHHQYGLIFQYLLEYLEDQCDKRLNSSKEL